MIWQGALVVVSIHVGHIGRRLNAGDLSMTLDAVTGLRKLLGMDKGPTLRRVVDAQKQLPFGFLGRWRLYLSCGHQVTLFKDRVPKRARCLECDET